MYMYAETNAHIHKSVYKYHRYTYVHIGMYMYADTNTHIHKSVYKYHRHTYVHIGMYMHVRRNKYTYITDIHAGREV